MSFITKLEAKQNEIEDSILQSNVIGEKYETISKKLEESEEEIENLLLDAYLDKIDQKQYSVLYYHLVDSLEVLHKILVELDKLLSKVKTKTIAHNNDLLGFKYRRLTSILKYATDNIEEAKKCVPKLLEEEKKNNINVLDNAFSVVTDWEGYCKANLSKLNASLHDGILGEIKFQNDKIEFFEYSGHVYNVLLKLRQRIEEIANTGYSDIETINNRIAYINSSLGEIMELLYTIPLHNDGVSEYFKNMNQEELESYELDFKAGSVSRLKYIFAQAQASYVSKYVPKTFEEEIKIALEARFIGASAVLKELENGLKGIRLTPKEFHKIEETWNLVKFSAQNSINYLCECVYIKDLPFNQNRQDIMTDDYSRK